MSYDSGHLCLLIGRESAVRADLAYSLTLARSTELRLAQGPGHLVVLSPYPVNVAVRMDVEHWDAPPPADTAEWQEVAEAPIEIDERGIEFYSGPAPVRLPAPPPGRYRIRICGRGFHTRRPGASPGDEWRLQLWPDPQLSPPRRLATWPGPPSQALVRNRANALRALLDGDLPPAPPSALLDALHPIEHPAVRAVATSVLATGWAADPTVPATLRRCATADPDPLTRREAVQGLARTPPHPDTRTTLLDVATRDPDRDVRASAVHAAATASPDDPSTLEWLRRLADGDDPHVRGTAVRGLGYGHHRDPDILTWLRPVADDTTAEQRWDAFTAIGTGWPNEPTILDWLYQHAAGHDQQTSEAALRTLTAGWSGHPEVRAFLQQLGDTGSAHARSSALAAIHQGWAHDDPKIQRWLRDRIHPASDRPSPIPLAKPSTTSTAAAAALNEP